MQFFWFSGVPAQLAPLSSEPGAGGVVVVHEAANSDKTMMLQRAILTKFILRDSWKWFTSSGAH